MSDTSTIISAEKFSLNLDNGATLEFNGQLFSEASWFDDETKMITRKRLYTLDTGEQVYSMIEGDGASRTHRSYKISLQNEMFLMDNGKAKLELPYDMLMLFTESLLGGIDSSAMPTMEHVEEILRAANC